MGPATIPPLLAALDSDSPLLKLDVLDVLRERHARYAREIAPFLVYVAASKSELGLVRKKATSVLAEFLGVPADRLPIPKVALTRQAERYYQKKVTFADPKAVAVWRWDGKGLVQGWPGAPTVAADRAEEYYGLHFARQALALDPTYRPAQLVALSLAVDKAMARAGTAAKLPAAVAELVARSTSSLLVEALERAIRDRRTGLVRALTRGLADRGEVGPSGPKVGGEPVLVRALYYPDTAVQFAAADGLLRARAPVAPKTASRVVEVLNEALARGGDDRERALDWLSALATAKPAGYDVAPAAGPVADAVAAGRVNPRAQTAVIGALAQLDGKAVQSALAAVVLDEKRPANARVAAARTLILNVQRQGLLLPPATLDSLRTLAGKAGTNAELKGQLDSLQGAIRPTGRETGELLRKFSPAPAGPPPKAKD
jgi:hypothetical protein